MALLVGRGKYLLQEEIGYGISGITYKAINQTNNQVVVIKTLKSDLIQPDEASDIRKKFLNEAHRLLECSHPNIIPYREFFSENGVPYIVMDYIPGKTLDKVVLPNNPLPEATAIAYIRQVGEALKVVHQNGLLHRDVKPQNLILREDNQQIILIDFGIARQVSWGSIQTHTNLASDGYAPIEQYLPKAKRTPGTDIYALAGTLYTLVTAQIPIAATLRDRITLDSPQKIRPELSHEISEAIMKGMALEIEERPSSIDEWMVLLSQDAKNQTLDPKISLESKSNNPTENPPSLLLDFKDKESEVVESTPSVQEKSSDQNLLWKILIIGLLVFVGLDYVWLKFQAPHFEDSPTNTDNPR